MFKNIDDFFVSVAVTGAVLLLILAILFMVHDAGKDSLANELCVKAGMKSGQYFNHMIICDGEVILENVDIVRTKK